jgi:hypothetical protein
MIYTARVTIQSDTLQHSQRKIFQVFKVRLFLPVTTLLKIVAQIIFFFYSYI